MDKETDLLSDEELLVVFKSISKEDRDKIRHLLWVVDMEESNPKEKKSYFDEFKSIYLSDDLTDGCVIDFLLSEVIGLRNKNDEGSMERLFYLEMFIKEKFSTDVESLLNE